MLGSLIVLVMAVAVAVPGVLLGLACHAMLGDRVPAGWRRVLCALATMLPAAWAPLRELGAFSGVSPVLASLLLWVPVAGLLERRRGAALVTAPALPASQAAVPVVASRGQPREAPGAPDVASPPAFAVAGADAVAVPADAPHAARATTTSRIVLWLIVVPWLMPVAMILVIAAGLLGPFHESNGGVLLIALAVLLALAFDALGVVVLMVRAARAAWRRRA